MKNIITLLAILTSIAFATANAAREVEIKTEKVDGVVHWMPALVEITEGETVKLVARHDLEGGFDYHGLDIKALGINEQVNRHKVFEKTVTISLKPGKYPIKCQFHDPKHAPATLVVKSK